MRNFKRVKALKVFFKKKRNCWSCYKLIDNNEFCFNSIVRLSAQEITSIVNIIINNNINDIPGQITATEIHQTVFPSHKEIKTIEFFSGDGKNWIIYLS